MASPANAPIIMKEAVHVRPSPSPPPWTLRLITSAHTQPAPAKTGVRAGRDYGTPRHFQAAAVHPYEVTRSASEPPLANGILVRGRWRVPRAFPRLDERIRAQARAGWECSVHGGTVIHVVASQGLSGGSVAALTPKTLA
jgi:hypothetical protein